MAAPNAALAHHTCGDGIVCNITVSAVTGAAIGGVSGIASGAGAGIESLSSLGGELFTNTTGGGVSVYTIVKNGNVVYAGITNDPIRRGIEHGEQLTVVVGGLTRQQARGAEQVLIENFGLAKNGGRLLNKINSISPSNPIYNGAKEFGLQLLQSIGYLP
jgi:hypothetical protein